MNFKTLEDSDGFIYVPYKRKRKLKISHLSAASYVDCNDFNISKLREIQNDLKTSNFFSDFICKLDCVLKKWNSSDLTVNMEEKSSQSSENIDLICYGLGKFTSCLIAFYQLGLLVMLKDILKPVSLSIYDPVFSKKEISILQELNMNVLDVNEEAKRVIRTKSIFFMPHCDLPLYNNLLWANWNQESLSKLIIIGNSFENYNFAYTRVKLVEQGKHMHLAHEFISEVKLTNEFKFPDIFNDFSIHYFKTKELADVSETIWSETKEPEYKDKDGLKLPF